MIAQKMTIGDEALRERHRERADRVAEQAEHVGALPADEVADLAADEDERRGDERLEGDRRLDAAHGRVQVVHDRRDRHVHQRRVDDEHEHRHRQQDGEQVVAAGRLLGGDGCLGTHARIIVFARDARRERRGEERRLLVRAAPHVRERQARAGLLPALAARRRARRRREREHGARVVRDAAVALALVPLGRRAPPGSARPPSARGHVGDVGERERAVAPPRPGADEPGPDRGDHRLVPAAPPRRAPTPRPTHWTSPSRHGAAATATSTSPRAFSARTASESDTGSAPPATWT